MIFIYDVLQLSTYIGFDGLQKHQAYLCLLEPFQHAFDDQNLSE